MLNRVVFIGRLTADPVFRRTNTKNIPVASFAIAVDRRLIKGREKETDFFNVTAWQATAEFVNNHFKKGHPICVEGRLQQRSWIDEATNTKRYAIDVVAESVHFAGFKRDAQNSDAGYGEEFNAPYSDAA
jgi:single-strand DNA-binding protein